MVYSTGIEYHYASQGQEKDLETNADATAGYAGADEDTAESIANGADIATIAFGGGSGYKTITTRNNWLRLHPSYSSVKGKTKLSLKWVLQKNTLKIS